MSSDKLLWSSDPGDLAIAPFLVVDGSKGIDRRLIDMDLDSDLYRTKLPSRIVIIDNAVLSTGVQCSFPPVLPVGGLSSEPSNQERFILDLYDEWISNLITRRGLGGNERKISVSIYFEDSTKAQAWEKAFGENPPPWASGRRFVQSKPEYPYSDLCHVNVWRHIKRVTALPSPRQDVQFYEMTSYHNAFFSFLYSVDPASFHARYLLRQLVESALLRILVIDDRVAGNIWSRQDKHRKIEDLGYMGIFIARKITVNAGNGKEKIEVLAGGEQDDAPGWVNLHLQENGSITNIEIDKEKGLEPTCAEFDVLFIHQTIFENKIAPSRKERQEKNEWVFNLKKKIPYVIFHSGRGKQTELLPKNAAFLEYSALQEHLLQEPSKFLLTQIALSAKG